MNRKNVLLYLAALAGCFLFGCAVAFALRAADMREIAPLSGGKPLDLTAFGFTMDVPQDFVLIDHTQENAASGGSALFAAAIGSETEALYLFCYANDAGDCLSDYPEQDVVAYYMNAGASEVRTRDFGGRRFICYRAIVSGEDGQAQQWDTYETWDETLQITFETQLPPQDALAILATIAFSTEAP